MQQLDAIRRSAGGGSPASDWASDFDIVKLLDSPGSWRVLAEFDDRAMLAMEQTGVFVVQLLNDKDLLQDARQRDFILTMCGAPPASSGGSSADSESWDIYLRRIEDPAFRKFIVRFDDYEMFRRALYNVRLAGDNWYEKVVYWDSLSDQALREELKPPPEGPVAYVPGYSIYYLARKSAQGRDVGAMDVMAASADALDFAFMAASLGASSVAINALKKAGKELTEESVKKIGKEVAEEIQERASKELGESLSKSLSKNVRDNVLKTVRQRVKDEGENWLKRNSDELLTRLRLMYSHLDEATQVDITGIVRESFRQSKIGRRSYKLTTGLEPRIFMRGDRRIVFKPTKVPDTPAGRFLMASAENMAADKVLSERVVQQHIAAIHSWVWESTNKVMEYGK